MNVKTGILFVLLSVSINATPQNHRVASQDTCFRIDRQKLLLLVNDARARGCKCGSILMPQAPALQWDDQLESAAQKHSLDMSRHNSLNHNGSDGSKFSERITRAGFNWNRCGENIAMGYETEEKVVEGWLNSPVHCKNIMNRDFQYMGVARSGIYWTQDFGSKQQVK